MIICTFFVSLHVVGEQSWSISLAVMILQIMVIRKVSRDQRQINHNSTLGKNILAVINVMLAEKLENVM